MVPARIVVVDHLPQLVNGKVDRQGLPAPEELYEQEDARREEEQWSPIEEILGKMWGEVLECSIHDREASFFELGGHSLLATRLMSRVQEVFKANLLVTDLFDAPTLAGLAQLVEQKLREGQGMQAPPLERQERGGQSLPLSFAQQRLWFLDQLEPETRRI